MGIGEGDVREVLNECFEHLNNLDAEEHVSFSICSYEYSTRGNYFGEDRMEMGEKS